jgi:hypothetical protein
MKKIKMLWVAALAIPQLATLPLAAVAGDHNQTDGKNTVETAAPEEKGAPLPLHTIEGTGGILITPTAYLVNPSERLNVPGWPAFAGLPAVGTTFVKANAKNIEAFTLTETLFKRLELGFSASRFGLGSFNNDVLTVAGANLTRSDVFLYSANARVLALEENSFGLPFLPAVTAGAQFKFNDGISTINRETGNALSSIGYKRSDGVDFTITTSKTLKYPFTFNRPLLLSAGVRFSEASQLGYVGFGDSYHATAEANIAYSITDWLWLAGEFRQKTDPYSHGITVNGYQLVRPEQDWWTVGTAFVFNKNATVTVGYGYFGNVLNTVEKTGWAVQLKYEF